MLFPLVMIFCQAVVYSVTGLMKVIKVDAYEMTKKFEIQHKQADVLDVMMSTKKLNSQVVPYIDESLELLGSARKTPVLPDGVSHIQVSPDSPTPENSMLPGTIPSSSDELDNPTLFATVDNDFGLGGQPAVIRESLGMSLSQAGPEYE